MNTRLRKEFPADLDRLRKRFEQSRRIRKARSRIPEPLWALAVRMAGKYGIHCTAKALHVDYYSLKKRTERNSFSGRPPSAKADAGASSSKKDAAPAFIELSPPGSVDSSKGVSTCCECTLELECAGDAKMRIVLKGAAMPNLVELSRSFWDRRP
jgi:hypothetical protein